MDNQSQETNSGNNFKCILQSKDNILIPKTELLRKERISSIVKNNSVKSLSEQSEEQSKIKRQKERKDRQDNKMNILQNKSNSVNNTNNTQ
jgi:hypothetical protein